MFQASSACTRASPPLENSVRVMGLVRQAFEKQMGIVDAEA